MKTLANLAFGAVFALIIGTGCATTGKSCGVDCSKPCCATKEACPAGCDKPCCADKKEACPVDCTKPCCAK